MFKKKIKKIYLCECSPTIHLKESGKCLSCGMDLREHLLKKPSFIARWFKSRRSKGEKQTLIWRRIAIVLIVWLIITNTVFGAALMMIMSKKDDKVIASHDNNLACNAYLRFKEIKSSTIPSGVPTVYGPELNISFDQVQEAINTVAPLGPTYGVEGQKITLEGTDLERYKRIGELTACQYCCGVTTLTKEDGSAACGCAHSVMMRGLAAYLIKNHSQEFSDEEILAELEKWKATFFPKQTIAAQLQALVKAGEPGIEELMEEFPDFLPNMVGGC